MVENSRSAVTGWRKWAGSFSQKMCWVAGAALVGMMAIGVSEVISRKFFNHPIKGSYEVIWLLSGIMIAFPIAYAQIQRAHIAIEMISFPKRAQAILDTIAYFLALVVFSILAWQVGLLGADIWSVGQVTDTLNAPLFPFLWGAAFACAVMCVVLLIDLYNSIAGLIRMGK